MKLSTTQLDFIPLSQINFDCAQWYRTVIRVLYVETERGGGWMFKQSRVCEKKNRIPVIDFVEWGCFENQTTGLFTKSSLAAELVRLD